MKVATGVVLACCLLSCWTVQGNEQQEQPADQSSPSDSESPSRGEQIPGFRLPRQPGFGAGPFGQQPGLRQPTLRGRPFGQQPRLPGLGVQPFGQRPTLRQPAFGRQPVLGQAGFGLQPRLPQPGLGLQPGLRQPNLGLQTGIRRQPGVVRQPAVGQQIGPFGTLNYPTVDLPMNFYAYAMCTLDPKGSQFNVRGLVQLRQIKPTVGSGPLEMVINVTGLNPNQQHGFQVRTLGDHSNGCASTSEIYNPFRVQHGGPNDVPFPNPQFKTRMVGDLGNLQTDRFGQVNIKKDDLVARITGNNAADVIGRSLVIYERPDDLGTTGTQASLLNGNTGDPVACCVVGKAEADSWPGNRNLINQQQPGQVIGQFSGLPRNPFLFLTQPLSSTNPQINPAQPVQPNPGQPIQTNINRLNPTNPLTPFNPIPNQFAFNQPVGSNPFGVPIAGGSPFARRGFNPVNPISEATAGSNPSLAAPTSGQQTQKV